MKHQAITEMDYNGQSAVSVRAARDALELGEHSRITNIATVDTGSIMLDLLYLKGGRIISINDESVVSHHNDDMVACHNEIYTAGTINLVLHPRTKKETEDNIRKNNDGVGYYLHRIEPAGSPVDEQVSLPDIIHLRDGTVLYINDDTMGVMDVEGMGAINLRAEIDMTEWNEFMASVAQSEETDQPGLN